jgi:hypothetical protein
MDKWETNILFDHTKNLRSGMLFLEPGSPEGKNQGSELHRKQDRSKSREPDESSEWNKFGILEYKR